MKNLQMFDAFKIGNEQMKRIKGGDISVTCDCGNDDFKYKITATCGADTYEECNGRSCGIGFTLSNCGAPPVSEA